MIWCFIDKAAHISLTKDPDIVIEEIRRNPNNEPQSGPQKQKTKKWMMVALLILLLIGLTTGLIVGLSNKKEVLDPILYVSSYMSVRVLHRRLAYFT